MREQCPKTCGLCSTFPATNRQTRTPTRRTTQIPGLSSPTTWSFILAKKLHFRGSAKKIFLARSTPEYKLWYFALRGRGEPIRLLFHYLNEPFEDFRIQPTDWASTYKKSTIVLHIVKWKFGFLNLILNLKNSLATPYGTIPILEVLETGEQLAQQFVILRYLARELGKRITF